MTRMVLDCQRTESSELPEGKARKMDQKQNLSFVSQNSSPFHDDTRGLSPSLSSLYWQPILCLSYSSLWESPFSGHVSILLMQVIIWWDKGNVSQAQNCLKNASEFPISVGEKGRCKYIMFLSLWTSFAYSVLARAQTE